MWRTPGKIGSVVLILFSFLSLPFFLWSAEWAILGETEFGPAGSSYVDIALSPFNVPYVVFRDNSNNEKISVMLRNGSTWEYLGSPGISAGNALYAQIEITPNGFVYVAYADEVFDGALTVKFWDGGVWQDAGIPGVSLGAVGFIDIDSDAQSNI